MDDPPFHDIATGQHGRKREDEDILNGVFYEGVTFFIDMLYEGHAFLHHSEIMFQGHSFCVVGEDLDGLICGQVYSIAGEVAFHLG